MKPLANLFLDRDGTVIHDKHYLSNPEEVELLPGVGKALGTLAAKGFRFFLVSNQSGVGRGMFEYSDAVACNERVAQLLRRFGVRFTDMTFCPHAPEEHCRCRKPSSGMWRAMKIKHRLRPEECLMIGDKEEDIRFAARAGFAGRILVLTGKGAATAEKFGLELPEETFISLEGCPQVPERPHLIIPGFHLLEYGLTLFERYRAGRGATCPVVPQ